MLDVVPPWVSLTQLGWDVLLTEEEGARVLCHLTLVEGKVSITITQRSTLMLVLLIGPAAFIVLSDTPTKTALGRYSTAFWCSCHSCKYCLWQGTSQECVKVYSTSRKRLVRIHWRRGFVLSLLVCKNGPQLIRRSTDCKSGIPGGFKWWHTWWLHRLLRHPVEREMGASRWVSWATSCQICPHFQVEVHWSALIGYDARQIDSDWQWWDSWTVIGWQAQDAGT